MQCKTNISFFCGRRTCLFLTVQNYYFTTALESFVVISLKGVCDRQQNLRQIRKAGFLSVANGHVMKMKTIKMGGDHVFFPAQKNKFHFVIRSTIRIFGSQKQ